MTPSFIRLVSTGALTTKRLCFNIWVVLFHFDKIFLCIVSTVCPGKTRNEWRVAVLPLRYHRLLFLCWTCNFTKVSKRWGGGGGGWVSGDWKWRDFIDIYLSLAVSRTTISRKFEVFLHYSEQSFSTVMEKSARPNANQQPFFLCVVVEIRYEGTVKLIPQRIRKKN